MKPRVIAFYLPQFYPFKENNEWWGKGFTEWTNVGKAKPLWKGHYQPRVPADLGYYDLRLPEVREQQAELAREAGVTAFCYWHYWFGNGKRLLERVFDEVLESGKPDFSFCLGWANHSWYAKTWNEDSRQDKLLIEQTYPGLDDAKAHFEYLLKAFKDSRYLKVDGKPFLFIFDSLKLPKEYITYFRTNTKKNGFPDVYLVANGAPSKSPDTYIKYGYDAVMYSRTHVLDILEYWEENYFQRTFKRISRLCRERFCGIPRNAYDYSKNLKLLLDGEKEKKDCVIPQIVPQWDHSPRSGSGGYSLLYNSSPEAFYLHVKQAMELIKEKPEEHQIMILKSWNEWAEGNYMEPDLKYGHGYIEALRKAISKS